MLYIVEIFQILIKVIFVVGDMSLTGFATNGDINVSPQTAPDDLVTGNVSLASCLLLCEKNVQCMSIFNHDGECHLFFKGFVDSSGLLPDPGWVFYNVFIGTDKCPYLKGYIKNRHLNICYKLHYEDKLNVYGFMDICASEGGALLRITSQDIQDHITAFLTDAVSSRRLIIQGSDRNNEGTFTFEDGSAMPYVNWYYTEPNNAYGNEDFIAFSTDENGTWYDIIDIDPNIDASFICEITK